MAGKRVVYFDFLNIFAALAVVFLHCNSMVHIYSDTIAWKQALLVECCFYWAVPIFFMLSGANLFNYRNRYSTAEFFKKRFIRILIPFVLWSAIYAAYYKINPMEIGIRETFNRFFNSQIITTFWFFIPMLSVYLAMPVLSLLKEHKKVLWYMVGLSFVLCSTMPYVFRYLNLNWNYSLTSLTTGGFIIYTILGYLLAQTDLKLYQRIIIYLLGLFALALRYFGTIFLSQRDMQLNNMFFDYLQYHTVLLGVSVFVFFKNSKLIAKLADYPWVTKFLKELSGLSFGVYLIHILVMEILQKYIQNSTYTWRLAVPACVFIISAIIIYLLKKIPLIKYLVP